ncbi:MAG: LysM peptidoglycan-binding domain-containing protein [Chitinispirillales bacterium]|jgi:membrane-bound lytic murein transglycosylase D|nr:LysM peptidoglycan-binding domain-containing protein [Chitinispirillales bacterium]
MRKYLIVFLSVVFFVSCGNNKKHLSPQEDFEEADSTMDALSEISLFPHIINDNFELAILADSMLSIVEDFSINGDFDGAQRIVKILFEILPLSDESESTDFDKILNRIAKLYSEKMPPAYLDSVPQSFTAFVTRYQFQMIMMEIDTANLDMFQIPINCAKGLSYDVPIIYNKRVQKALLALLSAEKSDRMTRLLNRSMFYRPFMEKMFEEAELPKDITYLPLLESAFNPKAYSRAHASGLWQFIPSTGKIFGLRNSYWLDERRDPIKSTVAAIAYFKRLYSLFDDWYLALASYNCGEGKINRLLREAKEKKSDANYWDLKLPTETMNYVPLYIGYQIIAKNPKCFGYVIDSSIVPFPYDTVKISDCIDMGKIAKGLGMPVDELREINPHIKQFCTPPDVNNVTLYIPAGKQNAYKTFYATLKPEDKVKWYRYKIASGDNLGSIANKFGTTIQAIKDMNRMKNNTLVAGRYILLPLPENETTAKNIIKADEAAKKNVPIRQIQKPTSEDGKINYVIASGETLYSIAKLYGISVDNILKWNPNIKPKYLREGDIVVIYMNKQNTAMGKNTENLQKMPPQSENPHKYVVQNGDNLFQISNKLKVSLSDLISWNKKDNDSPIIYPGETLVYYPSKNSPVGTSGNIKVIKPSVSGNSNVVEYLVKNGDTFYSIAKMFSSSVAELETLNNIKAGNLKAGQTIKILDNTPNFSVNPKSNYSASSEETTTYRVRSGDTFYSIARMFSTTTEKLQALNNMKANDLKAGQTIKISEGNASIASKQNTSFPSIQTINYKVQNGDYLYKLANKFNVSVQEICLTNNFSQNRQLIAGETIKIPVK